MRARDRGSDPSLLPLSRRRKSDVSDPVPEPGPGCPVLPTTPTPPVPPSVTPLRLFSTPPFTVSLSRVWTPGRSVLLLSSPNCSQSSPTSSLPRLVPSLLPPLSLDCPTLLPPSPPLSLTPPLLRDPSFGPLVHLRVNLTSRVPDSETVLLFHRFTRSLLTSRLLLPRLFCDLSFYLFSQSTSFPLVLSLFVIP